MSCFQLDPQHIAAVVGSALHRDRSSHSLESVLRRFSLLPGSLEADRPGAETHGEILARVLATANADSVNARYRGDDKTTPVVVGFKMLSRWVANPLSPVGLLKAIQSVEYQSCEFDGWEGSAAAAICECARSIAIHILPGYRDAEWSITSPPVGNAVSIFAL